MTRYSGNLVALAVALAALAGFVDAIAFSALGLFASFMSGNSTRFGVALIGGQPGLAAIAAALLLAFVAGVIAAAIVARLAGVRRGVMVLGMVAVLLALAAALGGIAPDRLDLLLAAAAMGATNGVFVADGEVTIGVTYMTGSLVRLGQRLAAALMGEGDRWGWLPYLALWGGFAAGAVMGAGAYLRVGLAGLWVAAGVAAVLAVVAGLVRAELS